MLVPARYACQRHFRSLRNWLGVAFRLLSVQPTSVTPPRTCKSERAPAFTSTAAALRRPAMEAILNRRVPMSPRHPSDAMRVQQRSRLRTCMFIRRKPCGHDVVLPDGQNK